MLGHSCKISSTVAMVKIIWNLANDFKMDSLRCEADEDVALSIAASSSVGASFQEWTGVVKTSSLEYRRGANSGLWKISHD
ncbi:hypothetical protein NPIL_418731 [Nephila pilipes]|uniref:Uncharacterized protein n=1 Tax=Nephila pilipes TaxID=299642 RepID=A0A8X6IKL1_NEPPI|nr:hypothetical protein NPIL_418731 [Nephila pilipes]